MHNFGDAAIQGHTLRARLFDAKRQPVFETPLTQTGITAGRGETRTVRLTRQVTNPLKWTAETPNLYDVTYELRRGTEVIDRVYSYFGIRTVGIRDGRVRSGARQRRTGSGPPAPEADLHPGGRPLQVLEWGPERLALRVLELRLGG